MNETETKQEVIERLRGKTTQEFYNEYCKAEDKLMGSIEELPNYGNECNCEEAGCVKLIYEGSHFDEIMCYCLSCGGYVAEKEWN